MSSLGPNLSFVQLTDISGVTRTSRTYIVGLILAFLRSARLRADCCERRLKDSKEERLSNQKECVVFCVGSSGEPGEWYLLSSVREVFSRASW